MIRNRITCSASGLCTNGWFHSWHPIHWSSFPDDKASLLLRRNGYKLILAKDAYCHHYGSVTLKDEVVQQGEQSYYVEGIREFCQMFRIDPWGLGFGFDSVFMKRVVGDDVGHIEVLGINCGLGSSPLKIKEQIKEYCHNIDCTLINLTEDFHVLEDLQGTSDEAAVVTSIKKLKTTLYQRTFQYMVWESPFLTQYKFKTLLELCLEHLALGGRLFLKLSEQSREVVCQSFPDLKELGNDWVILENK